MMSAYIISLPNCSQQLANLLLPLHQYPLRKGDILGCVQHEVFDFP